MKRLLISLLIGASVTPVSLAQDCPDTNTIGDRIGEAIMVVASAKADGKTDVSAEEGQLAALTILKWDLWGRASIGTTYTEVEKIADCHTEARCGLSTTYRLVGEKLQAMLRDGSWRTSSYEGVIGMEPPPSALAWAKKTIGCEQPTPEELADQLSDLIFGVGNGTVD